MSEIRELRIEDRSQRSGDRYLNSEVGMRPSTSLSAVSSRSNGSDEAKAEKKVRSFFYDVPSRLLAGDWAEP